MTDPPPLHVDPWRCVPDVRPSRAGWLAITPKGHPYRIGVEGDSPEEARRRFSAELAAWEELHERRMTGLPK